MCSCWDQMKALITLLSIHLFSSYGHFCVYNQKSQLHPFYFDWSHIELISIFLRLEFDHSLTFSAPSLHRYYGFWGTRQWVLVMQELESPSFISSLILAPPLRRSTRPWPCHLTQEIGCIIETGLYTSSQGTLCKGYCGSHSKYHLCLCPAQVGAQVFHLWRAQGPLIS
jgi:hypothetical protein